MKPHLFGSPRPDIPGTGHFPLVKFLVVAALLTGSLTFLTWLVAMLLGSAARFAEYRTTVILLSLAVSLISSSLLFEDEDAD